MIMMMMMMVCVSRVVLTTTMHILSSVFIFFPNTVKGTGPTRSSCPGQLQRLHSVLCPRLSQVKVSTIAAHKLYGLHQGIKSIMI